MTQEELMRRMKLLGSAIQINGDVRQLNMGDGTYIESAAKRENNAEQKHASNVSSGLPAGAAKYWQLLREYGFTDENNHLLASTTRQQAMYIAESFAGKFNLKTKWKTFEDIWGINNLAQEKNRMQETGKLPSRHDEIDKIFSL